MATIVSNQFQMIIYDKKPEILVINHFNKDKHVDKITKAFESGLLVQLNVNLQRNLMQHFMIIQSISFGLIIKSKILGYFPLSVCEIMNAQKGFRHITIQNVNICLKMVWQNPLVLKQWMSSKSKWTLLFMLLLKLLKTHHPIIRLKECIDLILTLMNTNFRWNQKHFIWLIHHEFPRKCMEFLKHIYIHQKIARKNMKSAFILFNKFFNTTKIFYMYCKQKKYKIYFNSWINSISNAVEIKHCRECQSKPQSMLDCSYFHQIAEGFFDRINKMVLNFHNLRIGSLTISQKYNIIPKKYQAFSRVKLCANVDCLQKNNDHKLKICKKCRVVYYCSRHCQKVDWKETHKNQCLKLYNKMNSFKWNLNCENNSFMIEI